MIIPLFRKDPSTGAAAALFAAMAAQARSPALYAGFGVEDSVEGRFEMLTLHVFLLLRRLKAAGPGSDRVAQAVVDRMFAALDDALREMGVGDLAVARRMRKLAEAFYGRVGAYGEALDGRADLESVLSRNVYGVEAAPSAPALSRYVQDAAAALAAQKHSRLQNGIVAFPSLESGEPEGGAR